jgi:ABC-type sugar transport system ATPase subunit
VSTLLELRGISRAFGGVRALVDVTVSTHAGEVHALLGANGAGKSTLMKILAGVDQPDAGTIVLDGAHVRFESALDAAEQGISIVSQELNLFPQLTVLDNLFLPQQPTRAGLVDASRMRALAEPILERLDFDVDLTQPVERLTLAERQLVEIARALIRQPRLLILDEPNSALQSDATERLLRVVRSLVDHGTAILYVSHLLEEVFSIADVATVLRDGRVVADRTPIVETTIGAIVDTMVGERPPRQRVHLSADRTGDLGALSVQRLCSGPQLCDADIDARPGEITGIAGLDGSGVHALLQVLFGMRKATSGSVVLPTGGPTPRSPNEAVRAGVALVPADRKKYGAMLDKPLSDNIPQISSTVLRTDRLLMSRRWLAGIARDRIDQLAIKASGPQTLAGELSGGNQQKVVLAKWLDADPALILLDDPTRGVDQAAKLEVHDVIREIVASGRVVVLATSDLDEMVDLADHVYVFRNGSIACEIGRDRLTSASLLHAINTGELRPSAGGSSTTQLERSN